MKVALYALLGLALLLNACSDEAVNPRTYEWFDHVLYKDITYKKMLMLLGEPDGDIGSGIHIYVYILKDATTITIGYSGSVVYARHLDTNGDILHVLIE